MDKQKRFWYAFSFGIRIAPPAAFCTDAEYEAQDWPRTRMTLAVCSHKDDSRDFAVMRAFERNRGRAGGGL